MARRIACVFGGSGFIGRHLVLRLVAQGWTVRVGVKDPESAAFLKPMGTAGQVIPIAADITEPATIAPLVADAEAVVNLVGILFERGRRTFQRVHVEGAQNVARSAAAAGVDRLIHLSAIGASRDSEAAYARSKAVGEEAVAEAFPGAAILRPSVVFGPEDQFFNKFAEMARIAPALPVFPTRFQPVYVGDVADAVIHALGNPQTAGKIYELGGPRVMSFKDIMAFVLQHTRRRRFLVPVPLMLAALEASVLQYLPTPPLTPDQVKLLATDNVVAASAATLADLGIEPTAVEAVVPSYLKRFRDSAHQAD